MQNGFRNRRGVGIVSVAAVVACVALAAPISILHARPATGIVFISSSADGHGVFSVRPDGSDLRQLTRGGRAFPLDPAGSPDGSRIAFVSERDSDMWTMDADGGRQQPVLAPPGEGWEPTWSPDSQRLAYVRFAGLFDMRVFTATPDGRDERDILKWPSRAQSPAWSPDGGAIAYWFSNKIHVVDLESGDTRVVVPVPATSPTWSPDSRELAYHREGLSEDIFVSDVDTRATRRLTNHPARDANPEWSRDGTSIAFQSGRDGSAKIYIMDSNGGNVRRLTSDGKAHETHPSWLGGGTLPVFAAGRMWLQWGLLKTLAR
ncbi:hypothetical protein HN371_24730 [Candidatus Poribacteria bacterium]|nr:hypothetical protein [Candidatus Poribacteria bacterium]MBT5533508.1 hypothetical protein [Candidatus Poribacteria bacterium]MBT5714274.1 hypothetical protein [Candidatus Poribacteria bacterium]MBT7097964.1 hypothetical protein [Candidatus Poribacteria bacterium]MBT7807211.1 hypothetical protein [Candidatus Poribacteria bacterium]